MINEQGNYEFLDFEKEKPKFIDTFVRFYGEKYRDIITNRINNIRYVPYLNRDFVTEYYAKTLADKREELVDYFSMLSARPYNSEMDDLIFDPKEGGSKIIYSLLGGENYTQSRCLDKATKKEIGELRDTISRVFSIPKEPKNVQYAGIQKLYTIYRRAAALLATRHKCDIIDDAQKYYDNCGKLTKYFLQGLRTDLLYKFTEHDVQVISNKELHNGDFSGLDCYGMLFTGTLDKPGLVEYFTTENFEKIADINRTKNVGVDSFEVMIGQLKAIYILGAKMKYLTQDEIESNEVEFNAKIMEKVLKEYNYQALNNFGYFIDKDSADSIEAYRQMYAEQLSSGCKFRQKLDKHYTSNYAHSDTDEINYCMYPDYHENDLNKPSSTIYFDESELFETDVLLGNLIHEIDHCVTHDKATKKFKRYTPVAKKGALGAMNKLFSYVLKDTPKDNCGRAIIQEGLEYRKYYSDKGIASNRVAYQNLGVTDLEENINERLSKELTAIYLSKYSTPFKDSALFDEKSIAEEKEDYFECQYMLWDFLTEDFYNKFYKHIKNHRINHKYPLYFSNGKLPENKTDAIMNFIKDKYDRYLNPSKFKRAGIMDYQKVAKLGNLITKFKENIMPALSMNDKEEFCRLTTGDYSQQSHEAQRAYKACCRERDKIMDSIMSDMTVPFKKREKLNDFTPTNIMDR